MLLPTQQSSGLAATNLMRSMLDGIEEQRKKEEAERTGKERDKITEARIGASEEAKRAKDKIATALFGAGSADPGKLKLDLIERLGKKLGIDTDEAKSGYRLGKAMEDVLKGMSSTDISKLSEEIGLNDLGVTMETLINAIKNPYADDGKRLKEALLKQANGGKLGTEVERVTQRLEDVADPKTLEELKLGPKGYDPTRVEDDETKAERQEDIKAAEAGKKLEDVQKTQDIIEKKNDEDVTEADATGTGGSADAASANAIALISVFAAAAEQIDSSDDAASDDAAGEQEASAQGKGAAKNELPTNGSGTTPNELNADALEELTSPEIPGDDQAGILPVSVDEIGLYELLKKKLAA